MLSLRGICKTSIRCLLCAHSCFIECSKWLCLFLAVRLLINCLKRQFKLGNQDNYLFLEVGKQKIKSTRVFSG